MDLSKHKGTGSTNLPWLDGMTIPEKGCSLRIDAAREPKKAGAVVVYLDVTIAKTKTAPGGKFTWSIRKGFTLDGLMEALGAETDGWKNKSVKVVRGGNDGQYVNLAQE